MPKEHIVEQGECLTSLAREYGFGSWERLYSHDLNEALRELRPNPNLLCPGDVVLIPDRRPRNERVGADAAHRVRVVREQVELRLRITSCTGGAPREGRYRLEGSTIETRHGTLDEGELVEEIPADLREVVLTVLGNDGSTIRVVHLQVGSLDPPDTVSGLQGRLVRLGYAPGAVDGDLGPLTRAALEAFRDREGLDTPPDDSGVAATLAAKAGS